MLLIKNMPTDYNQLFNQYTRQYSQLKRQQEEARAQAFYDEEQRNADERKKLHDDPASLWGGDVGLALARLLSYAQQTADDKLQDLLVALEYEMHNQMISVQYGIDELKQRLIANEKEIQEERDLVAGSLALARQRGSLLQPASRQANNSNNNNNNNSRLRASSSPPLFSVPDSGMNSPSRRKSSQPPHQGAFGNPFMSTEHDLLLSQQYDDSNRARTSSQMSTTVNNESFFANPSALAKTANTLAHASTMPPRPPDAPDQHQQQQNEKNTTGNNNKTWNSIRPTSQPQKPLTTIQQQQQQNEQNQQRRHYVPRLPPTLQSEEKISHALHWLPVMIGEALWRELKCETVNIFIKGSDNASNLLYSVPQRSDNPNLFKRLHRSVESAVFQHQVAVCAWDATSKNPAMMMSANNLHSTTNFAQSTLSRGSGGSTSAQTASHLHHPQSYVVWPVVMVVDESSDEANNNQQQDKTDLPSTSKKTTTSKSNSQDQQQQNNKQSQQQQQQHPHGARYKTVAAIECINKKVSSYSMLSTSILNSNSQHQQRQQNLNNSIIDQPVGGDASFIGASTNFGGNATTTTPGGLPGTKLQFSKSDEALIAAAAKLMASCFENFPSSCTPTDDVKSHKEVCSYSRLVTANVQPLPGEKPSVSIPSAFSAVESACLANPPVKIFRGPSAGVFKPTIGHQTSNKIPSSPYALANSTKEAKSMTIDSFTHDGNLRSLEASISYLDSMWKAAFSDNVGMHEECRKMSTKIRDLSFICSQVEEIFAAARKLNSIDDMRSFLRTAELSLKSGSRALLGTAMKISLESQINNNGDDVVDASSPNRAKKTASQQQQQQKLAQAQAVAEKFAKNDFVTISDIHIDGPEGLRHYSVDPKTKKEQMLAIEQTIKNMTAANNGTTTPRTNSNNNNNNAGGHGWLRHHHHNQQQQQSPRNISTPQSLKSTLPKIPPLPSK